MQCIYYCLCSVLYIILVKCLQLISTKSQLISVNRISLPKVSSYTYLGIDFSSKGAWDMQYIYYIYIIYKEVIR